MNKHRFRYLRVRACCLGLLLFCAFAPQAQAHDSNADNEITFTSWPGPYMRSQMLGFVRPYEEQTGTRVHVASYNGGIREIRDQVESAWVRSPEAARALSRMASAERRKRGPRA